MCMEPSKIAGGVVFHPWNSALKNDEENGALKFSRLYVLYVQSFTEHITSVF